MKTTKQKSEKKSFNEKAVQKFIWTLALSVADQINGSIVTLARTNKISLSEKDIAMLAAMITSTAEAIIPGATKTLINSLHNEK
jgi:predicted nucleic acid-binding protein